MLQRHPFLIVLLLLIPVAILHEPASKLYQFYHPDKERQRHDNSAVYSVDLLERARNREPEALLYLSNMQYQGIVVEQNSENGKTLLEASALLGYAPAKREYARRIIMGDVCVPDNTDEMCLLLHTRGITDEKEKRLKAQAIKRQKDYAMTVLKSTGFKDDGWSAYYYGLWLSLYPFSDEEIEEGISLLEKAAERGNSQAMMLLAHYCYEGKFVEKNPALYFYWMKEVADRGYEHAKLAIAKCYILGVGTPKNTELGFRLCDELRAQDYAPAIAFTEKLQAEGIRKEVPAIKRKYVSEYPKYPNREKLARIVAFFDPSMAMVCAAKDGDWKKVKEYLLFRGADVDSENYLHGTALGYALSQKNYQAVHDLLLFGANPNIKSYLSQARLAGKEFVLLLLDFGADPALHAGMTTILSYQDMELLKYCFEKYDLLSPQVFFCFMDTKDDRFIDYYLSKIKNVNVKNMSGMDYMYVAGNDRRMDIANKLMLMGYKSNAMHEAAKEYDREMQELDKWDEEHPIPPFTNRDYKKRFEVVKKWLERSLELGR